jgi:hypothetical protein
MAVKSLLAQEPAPEKVIVWHNAPSSTRIRGPGVVNIFSEQNYGCRARYIAALQLDLPVVVMMDDDVELRDKSVCAELVDAAMRKYPKSIVGACGRSVLWNTSRPYSSAPDIRTFQSVAVIKGWLLAVRTVQLIHALKYQLPVAIYWEDDITFNAALQIETGVPSMCLGLQAPRLKMNKTNNGLERRSDHMARRDAACLYWQARGWKPLSADKLAAPAEAEAVLCRA